MELARTPITPLSLPPIRGLKTTPKPTVTVEQADHDDAKSDVQIVVEEATPLATRLAAYELSVPMNLDSPISPTPGFGSRPFPPRG